LGQALSGKVSKHYKSEQKDTCTSIRKINANNFKQNVIEDSQDHLVFEYSEFCPTCKEISPVIDGFAEIIQKKGTFEHIQDWGSRD
jgi:thioredoxin-like negative regulator of GroEL